MLVALLLVGTFQASHRPDTVVVAVEEAVRRAESVSPFVAASLGEVRRARAARAETFWPFASNPTVEYGRVRRRAAGATTHDRDWAVTQEVEIAGQSFTRRGATTALLRAAESRVEDARRLSGLEVREIYLNLVIAEREVTLADTAARFAGRLADFALRQFDAGEINRLEVNVAVLDAARARSAAERAHAAAAGAAADLARVLAVPPDSTVRSTALPPLPEVGWDSLAALLPLALARRPDLHATAAELAGATKELSAARRGFIPNLTVAAIGGQEGGTDDLLGVQLGIQVPLFYRGQAARGAAEADLATARARRAATERAIQAELEAGVARFRRFTSAERQFAREVLRAADENVSLTEQALAEGEVDLTEVILLRRTALDAQREYLAVLADAYTAWFELAATLNVAPLELTPILTGKN